MKPEKFARLTIEKHIKQEGKLEIPKKLTGIEIDKAGAFVSIKTTKGDLRGCIGTIQATKDSIIDEIMTNAISAATADPRFQPVKASELDDLKYSVDVLHYPEPIKDFNELDPKVYGIIVYSAPEKRALLLPDLEGIDTVQKQVVACMQKAGIKPEERIFVHRFKVDRFSE